MQPKGKTKMSQYDNTNRGQVWVNDKKDSERHPDLKGSINVDGKEFWLSAWKKKPDANPKAPVLSFSIQAKDEQAAPKPQAAAPAAISNDDEDLPW